MEGSPWYGDYATYLTDEQRECHYCGASENSRYNFCYNNEFVLVFNKDGQERYMCLGCLDLALDEGDEDLICLPDGYHYIN
jgi:hypothetical protein